MPIIKDVRAAKGESQVKAGSGIFGSHTLLLKFPHSPHNESIMNLIRVCERIHYGSESITMQV